LVRITVDVKTNSSQEGVEELGDGLFLVHVKAPKRKGKANLAVIKLLRKHFGQPVRIVSGQTSTRKIVEII
jgi:uncharacterized protein (TIGR00251 family)